MAASRMFNQNFMESDNFLTLSADAQILYVHLALNADDDGFVTRPKSIIRMIASNEKFLDELVLNDFVIRFNDGYVVLTHWLTNNHVKKDRYHPTMCKNDMELLEIVTTSESIKTGKDGTRTKDSYAFYRLKQDKKADDVPNKSHSDTKPEPAWLQSGDDEGWEHDSNKFSPTINDTVVDEENAPWLS